MSASAVMNQYLLSPIQTQQVVERTEYYIQLANQILNLHLKSIDITFDLKGRASGMFVVKNNHIRIRYNEIIFSQYYADALVNTVAHEVAHYVVFTMRGLKKVKPHGKEWQAVMDVFGIKPEVTSSYDVSELPLNRQKQFNYSCSCMSHTLSTTRHNRVQNKKAVYKCRKCRESLSWLMTN